MEKIKFLIYAKLKTLKMMRVPNLYWLRSFLNVSKKDLLGGKPVQGYISVQRVTNPFLGFIVLRQLFSVPD